VGNVTCLFLTLSSLVISLFAKQHVSGTHDIYLSISMKSSLLTILGLVLFQLCAPAQHITWERSFSYRDTAGAAQDSKVLSMYHLPDSSLIAFGQTDALGVHADNFNSFVPYTAILKLRPNGDTIKVATIGDTIYSKYFAQSLSPTNYWVAGALITRRDTQALALYRVDTGGRIIFWRKHRSKQMPKYFHACAGAAHGGTGAVSAQLWGDFASAGIRAEHDALDCHLRLARWRTGGRAPRAQCSARRTNTVVDF
jgi:hypothetical protein